MIWPNSNFPLDEHLERAIAASSIELTAHQRHDAIVVGAGAAGGVAAALLCEAGLRVLCLDAGARVSFMNSPVRRTLGAIARTLSSPELRRMAPPGAIRKAEAILLAVGRVRQPVQSAGDAWLRSPDAFVDDKGHPYVAMDDDPAFHWLRAHLLGGRTALAGHDHEFFRLSPSDIAPNDADPAGWPVSYDELARWYDFIETRIGLSGVDDSAGDIPDSRLSEQTPANASETALMDGIRRKWPTAAVMMGRDASPPDFLCRAAATGTLLVRTGAVAQRVEVDGRGAVRGVHWLDQQTGKMEKASAPIVFLCASALESTRILMMSGEELGGDRKNSALGRYLVDHVVQKAEGVGPALPGGDDDAAEGRRIYLPGFDARGGEGRSADGGFNVSVRQAPGWRGRSWFRASATAQMQSASSNRISLDPDRLDAQGAPLLRVHCRRSGQDGAGVIARTDALRQLAEVAGAELHRLDETPIAPGLAGAEGGTARMGESPEDSVLDPFGQCWNVKGLYVTDAASMRSQGRVGPALTVMALTARACAYALQISPQENKAKERARARAAREAETQAVAKPAAKKRKAPAKTGAKSKARTSSRAKSPAAKTVRRRTKAKTE